MGISSTCLWSFCSELASHELTNLLCEAINGYKHNRLENSIGNRLLDHNNWQGSIWHIYNWIVITYRSIWWNDIIELPVIPQDCEIRVERHYPDFLLILYSGHVIETLRFLWQLRVVYELEMHKRGSKIINHGSNALKSLKTTR